MIIPVSQCSLNKYAKCSLLSLLSSVHPQCLQAAVENYLGLLIASRDLNFLNFKLIFLPRFHSQRLQAAVENYLGLLIASRNLDFFTSFYRFLIQLLPAAVVAPLFFQVRIAMLACV